MILAEYGLARRDPDAAPPVAALERVTIARELDAASGAPGAPLAEAWDLDLVAGRVHALVVEEGGSLERTAGPVLRVLAGLDAPASGAVSWHGVALADLRPDLVADRRRRGIGHVPVAPLHAPGLDALANVLLAAVRERRGRTLGIRARDLLTRLGVAPHADPATMPREVALARALLLTPPLLLVAQPDAPAEAERALLAEAVAGGAALVLAIADRDRAVGADSTTHLREL